METLEFLYHTVPGRLLLKGLIQPNPGFVEDFWTRLVQNI